MRGRHFLTTIAGLIALLLAAQSAPAMTPSQIGRCLDMSGHSALSTDSIISGLVLTRDQKLELRARLSSFDSVRGFQGIDGIGLTPDQAALIQKRLDAVIAERKAHGIGWPCPAFKNPARSIAFVKATLVYNGFRPAMRIGMASPRQIWFTAIQDGITYYGRAVKISVRQIRMQVTSTDNGGDAETYATTFDA